MTLSVINQYLGIIAFLATIANSAWIWLNRPTADINKRIDKLEEDQGAEITALVEGAKRHDRRIQRVEDDIRHLPTKDDLHEVKEELAGVKTELAMVAKVVGRLDEYMRARP